MHLVLKFRSHIVIQGICFGYVTFYMYFILSLHIIRKKYLWRNHNRKCLRKEYTSVLWKISNDQTSSYLLIHFFTFSRRLKNIYVYIHITIWNGIKRFRPRQDFFCWKITHFALVEFASKVSTKNQMLSKREIWQSLWTLSWRTRTIMTMAISTTPSLWPLSSTHQNALSMVTELWVIKDVSRLPLQLVWS